MGVLFNLWSYCVQCILVIYRYLVMSFKLSFLSDSSINYLFLGTLILVWGTSFLLINRSLIFFSPDQIAGLRLFIAAIIIFSILFFSGKRLPKLGPEWLYFIVIAVIANLLPFWLIAIGQTTISSGMAGLLMAIMPLLTIVLAHFFLINEKLNRFKIIGFVFGIFGVGFILGPTIVNTSNSLIGCLLVLVAACCYACGTIISKRMPSYDPLVSSSCTLLCAVIISFMIWPNMFAFNYDNIPFVSLLSLFLLGALSTAGAMLLYFQLINRAGATFLSNINYLIPVVAYFVGALVLGEVILWHDILALFLIIGGIVISRKNTLT